MSQMMRAFCVASVMGVMAACSEIETQYFKDRVNEATAERVAKRYGAPHKIERNEGGGTVWTYFDRGSGTSSYTGYAKSHYCRVYILTFDQEEILRDWKQATCEG